MFNKMMGKTRYVVCRIMLHLGGSEVAPILGLLNRLGREAYDSDGDLHLMGEGLTELCQTLLQNDTSWLSASNEGDAVWSEGEAGDYVNQLFTDSAERFLSNPNYDSHSSNHEPLSIPVTQNIIVMITVAFEGEAPDLETDLSNVGALKNAFKTLINLHYKHKLRAIQVHFSPAQLGDELSSDQLIQYYPELIPL